MVPGRLFGRDGRVEPTVFKSEDNELVVVLTDHAPFHYGRENKRDDEQS